MSYLSELRQSVGSRLLLVPSVAAVIHDEQGRVLVGRKAEDGSWSLPAGAIEPGESPPEAVQREVFEETGLEVVRTQLLDVVGGKLYRHVYPNGDEVEYVVSVYTCTTTGSFHPCDQEFVELQWTAPEDLLGLLSLPYPVELFHESRPRLVSD